MASMLVSGKAVLHTNSARHLTASWKESIAEAKCSLKVFTEWQDKKQRDKALVKQVLGFLTADRKRMKRFQEKQRQAWTY